MKLKSGDIIEGYSISDIKLGWSIEQLCLYLKNDYKNNRLNSITSDQIISIENAEFLCDEKKGIYQISVFGDFGGLLRKQIGIGSNLRQLRETLGYYYDEKDVYVLRDYQGICFTTEWEDEAEEWDEEIEYIESISVYFTDYV